MLSSDEQHQCHGLTHPCGLRSRESSMLCWKLGEPRSGAVLLAEVADAVLMVVLHRLAVPLGHAFGGLVTRMLSDSDRFFTWCITPRKQQQISHASLIFWPPPPPRDAQEAAPSLLK